jgi:hypothetical protein
VAISCRTWDLLAGGYYVDVHTQGNQGGEIRGQLLPTDVEATSTLSGGAEVPPVTPAATGEATATSSGFTISLVGTFEGPESDLMNVSAFGPADIHVAPAGQNGGVAFALVVDSADDWGGTLLLTDVELTEKQRADFVAGRFYVDVHTVDHGDGEIRGQLEPFGVEADRAVAGRRSSPTNASDRHERREWHAPERPGTQSSTRQSCRAVMHATSMIPSRVYHRFRAPCSSVLASGEDSHGESSGPGGVAPSLASLEAWVGLQSRPGSNFAVPDGPEALATLSTREILGPWRGRIDRRFTRGGVTRGYVSLPQLSVSCYHEAN